MVELNRRGLNAPGRRGRYDALIVETRGQVQDVVGRERELAALEVFLADAVGRTAVFALEGAPGIGKTTVWRVGVERARAAGAQRRSRRSTAPS